MISVYNLLWIVPAAMAVGAAIWTLLILNWSDW